ncbi:SorT family sulfite dehydrogenase catalytic subunit [Pseudomonas sp. MBLB4136]|uniref:SorT family sulfite dehydrogenase catalytic subunit n=1 Tax=Pseudomonas sp. MBLB4136 TaxID=3451558 RepID=UPI003F74E25E
MNDSIDLHRRHLLLGSTGALASAGLLSVTPHAWAAQTPLPDYVSWKTPEALIVHSDKTLETRREAQGTGLVTSNERLFIRNNLPPPDPAIVADPDAWSVTFQGVNNPRSMTLGQLKQLGVETVASVLQCSGNGRAFFPHGASGTQWSVGAAGCVLWTGVPMRLVIKALGGIADGRRYMTSTGGEALPEGLDLKSVMVERSVPLRAVEQALLAWELNGEALPLAHGGPLRMVLPGFYGVNNVKYVKQVAFTAEQSDAKIQVSGYRIRPIGQGGAADQPSMWEMNVKSWITRPLQRVAAGRVMIQGVAFGGAKPLLRVEVSTNGGNNWHMARFIGPDLGPHAWRPFLFIADLEPGSYSLASRAIDFEGDMQPRERVENERGYGNNSWRDHAVDIQVV